MNAIPDEAKLYLGQDLGGYRVEEFLAEGGFALVFRATCNNSGAQVALKILRQNPQPENQMEFASEGELLAKLKSCSNVVGLIGSGEEPLDVIVAGTGVRFPIPVRFHVLELAAGCLEELLFAPTPLPWPERLALYRGAAKGVHQMHDKEIVHRDLKSSNCLLFVDRGSTDCQISDLGRSRDLTRPARFAAQDYLHGRGDLRFAPPEFLWLQGTDNPMQWRQADLYGMGSLFFEMATGQGITGVALGSGITTVKSAWAMHPDVRRAAFEAQRNSMRSQYVVAFDLLQNALPPSIRQIGTQMVRQLCDPDPAMRTPRQGFGKRRGVESGLNWLLRRTSAMILTLNHASRQAAAIAESKERRRVAER
ncbi:MAG: tyrosine protein kinase:Serine/threonine protein kinase [Acidimicrobiales bacterium]|nr:tyrosine protein kinase:Serine/threonine protein kinase [Acidimicrobiales bacterium]